MPSYWNALDCALHLPRELNTAYSGETFSLALAQAMVTGLPVIGNTCGSVPYQLGDEGIITEEGDIKAIREHMEELMADRDKADYIGTTMESRARSCFSTSHLNECFYSILEDVLSDRFDKSKSDMVCFFPEIM